MDPNLNDNDVIKFLTSAILNTQNTIAVLENRDLSIETNEAKNYLDTEILKAKQTLASLKDTKKSILEKKLNNTQIENDITR